MSMAPLTVGIVVNDADGVPHVYLGHRVLKSGSVEHRFHMAYPDAAGHYVQKFRGVYKQTLVKKFPGLIRYAIKEKPGHE